MSFVLFIFMFASHEQNQTAVQFSETAIVCSLSDLRLY